jgi:radical SAM protein with 4Fe4S-binding SPASM domain
VYGSDEGVFATGHAGKGEGKKTMVLSRYIGGCGAGRCYCSIQPNGIINACVYIPSEEVGDIRRQGFKQIWDNALFDTLSDRDDRGDHCGVCDYKHYCGGCRARAESYTGDIQAGDPGCVYNAHEWVELTESADRLTSSVQASEGCCGGNCGSHGSERKVPLIQIMAVGAVSAAARTGELLDMEEEDVRDVDDVADRLKELFAVRSN